MKSIHKLIALALVLTVPCSARAATATSAAADAKDTRLKVVTTLSVLKDLAEQVGGDLVDVVSLSDPSEDPHYVQPRPTLMKRAREADVFVELGLQLELWAGKVVEGSGNTKIQSSQP